MRPPRHGSRMVDMSPSATGLQLLRLPRLCPLLPHQLRRWRVVCTESERDESERTRETHERERDERKRCQRERERYLQRESRKHNLSLSCSRSLPLSLILSHTLSRSHSHTLSFSLSLLPSLPSPPSLSCSEEMDSALGVCSWRLTDCVEAC